MTSRAAALQMSREMLEFAPDGERYYEKAIDFLHSLFRRWATLGEHLDPSTLVSPGSHNR